MNRKVREIRSQYTFVSARFEKRMSKWAIAAKKAESAKNANEKVLLQIQSLMGDWGAYQNELRKTMVTINGDLDIKITQLNEIKMEFEGFREYLVNLETQEEELFLQCKEVEVTYIKLVE